MVPLPAADLDLVAESTEHLWKEFRGAHILVTGATGFFGRWILETALDANRRWGVGVKITAISRDPERYWPKVPHLKEAPLLRWLQASVTTIQPTILGDQSVDAVIHMATEANMQAVESDPAAATGVIAGGTEKMLAVAKMARARRFLFTSSGSAYGVQPPKIERIPETFDGMPGPEASADGYAIAGWAKLQAERLCLAMNQPQVFAPVIARCFTFSGPGLPLDGKFAFGNFLRDALAGREIVIKGDGTPVRSYLYAADLTIWLWTLLWRGTAGRVYNVGSENAVSLAELAKIISREVGGRGVLVQGSKITGASPRYVPETKRVRDELGVREKIDLASAIRRTAEWHRAMM